MQNDDQLAMWAKEQRPMFKEPTEKQIEIVKCILRRYPSLIKVNRKYDANPWVIALTIEMNNDPQKRLFVIKRIVVTEEKLIGNKVKIPFVCRQYSVDSINIVGLFREEGWAFDLIRK